MMRTRAQKGGAALVSFAGLAAASYATFVGAAWLRYGRAVAGRPEEADACLDRFMPEYDVVERHHIRVAAPSAVTFGALMDMDLEDSALIHAIFKAREVLLGAEPNARTHQRGLVAVTQELGWGMLAELPGREIVMGAVTQPWHANVVF